MRLLLLLAACKSTGEVRHDEAPPTAVDALRITSVNASVGAGGSLTVGFDVTADATAFALEGTLPDDAALALVTLRDPSGAVVVDCSAWVPNGDHALTDACWSYSPTILDYPIVPGQSVNAGRWTAEYATDGAPGDVAEMVLVQRPTDDDERTDLYAQILVADHLPPRLSDPAAYDRAVQHWIALWDDHGIALHARWGTVDLGAGHSGEWGWREVADGAGEIAEITVVLTRLGEPGVLGYVTAAPGPVLPGKDGVLVIDVPAHAGRDGRLDEAEAQTLGETIAHEALHYAGLYHPADGAGAPDQWDPLDDTLDCADWGPCDEALGANLMYWTTVYDDEGRVPQIELTAGQRFTVRHWAGGL